MCKTTYISFLLKGVLIFRTENCIIFVQFESVGHWNQVDSILPAMIYRFVFNTSEFFINSFSINKEPIGWSSFLCIVTDRIRHGLVRYKKKE